MSLRPISIIIFEKWYKLAEYAKTFEVLIMAKRPQKTWQFSTKKQKSSPSEFEKSRVTIQCNELVETELKPKYIEEPPPNTDRNYKVDIFTKWYRGFFYFCSRYNCPSPKAISPSFESRFARLEYIAPDRFDLAYMRHTGQWHEVQQGLTLKQCLEEIRTNPLFHP